MGADRQFKPGDRVIYTAEAPGILTGKHAIVSAVPGPEHLTVTWDDRNLRRILTEAVTLNGRLSVDPATIFTYDQRHFKRA